MLYRPIDYSYLFAYTYYNIIYNTKRRLSFTHRGRSSLWIDVLNICATPLTSRQVSFNTLLKCHRPWRISNSCYSAAFRPTGVILQLGVVVTTSYDTAMFHVSSMKNLIGHLTTALNNSNNKNPNNKCCFVCSIALKDCWEIVNFKPNSV